jgi:hypothetical protein
MQLYGCVCFPLILPVTQCMMGNKCYLWYLLYCCTPECHGSRVSFAFVTGISPRLPDSPLPVSYDVISRRHGLLFVRYVSTVVGTRARRPWNVDSTGFLCVPRVWRLVIQWCHIAYDTSVYSVARRFVEEWRVTGNLLTFFGNACSVEIRQCTHIPSYGGFTGYKLFCRREIILVA